MKIRFLLAGFLLLLAGCSSAKVDDYAGHKPDFDIRHYLNGNIDAWGVFLGRDGMVDQQFHVAMKGSWKGNDGTLKEHFTFDDGHTDDRVWTIHFTDGHHFTATAHDVVGEATGGQFGNAVNMTYTLRVPVGNTTYDMAMNDWMYEMNGHIVINHTVMSKLGVKVGELFLTFEKK